MKIKSTGVSVHGWVVLDKPVGLTSVQALGRVRRLVGGGKAGHGGTLDPLASGVLPLAFGEATKLIPHVMDGEKEYDFTVKWGESRATDDAEGEVIATSVMRPTPDAIASALPDFIGEIEQIPPRFSAIKLDGERAYDIARSGGVVEIAARRVFVRSLELVNAPDADHASFRVACGKGMYVRSLTRDLAEKLGTCGHVAALRRTRVGGFSLSRAISLENLEDLSHKGQALTAMLDLRTALDDIPGLTLTPSEAQRLRSGQGLLIRPQHSALLQYPVIMAEHQGTPVAIVEARDGLFRVVRGFHF